MFLQRMPHFYDLMPQGVRQLQLPHYAPTCPSFGVSSLPALPAPFRTHTLHLSSTSSFATYSASPSSFFHATR
ncbi:hypothetical protein B0H13DRAFT_2667032 [Mycena leptocephala]|nr:hypothetical protein B0H13DRAFT_2667032 [Mycena leptocephala]